MDRYPNRSSQVRRALIVGGLLIAASYLLKRLSPAVMSPDTAERILGVLMGGVVVAYANALPKLSQGEVGTACRTDEHQASRRFAGWMLALGGLAYVLFWAFAPLAVASVASTSILAVAVAAVIVHRFWRAPRPRSS